VLEAGGDERVEAPEDQDTFGGIIFCARRTPDREADEPVAEYGSHDELERRGFYLFQSDGV